MPETPIMLPDLTHLIEAIPTDSIVSRTVYQDSALKVILFAFAQGQGLSEHSAGQAATIHLLAGSASITLGDTAYEAQAGAWMHLPPRLKHSLLAHTPVYMLLYLHKEEA